MSEPLAAKMKSRLQAAANVVTEARRAVEAGNNVDLSGIENEVNGICTALSELPSGAGADLKPVLVGLVDDLDKLTSSLTAAHEKLAADIGELSARRRANRAYGQPQE